MIGYYQNIHGNIESMGTSWQVHDYSNLKCSHCEC